jgi:hypothetical protein
VSTTKRRRRIISALALTAALAAPLLAAGSANAASVSTWDKVAQCESSGNWSINTGNGYYGGLQFSLSTWNAFGGADYAAYPNQASKNQQILIGEKVLASQGQNAWPTCGPAAGLGADTADPFPSTPPASSGAVLKWLLSNSATSHVNTVAAANFGNQPMVPIAGDWDGNGTTTMGAYDAANAHFYLTNTNAGGTATTTVFFGNPGDKPVVGRWDGGKTTEIGVYRPSNATFYLRHADGSVSSFVIGNAGNNWTPLAGDWTHKGYDSIALYDPSNTRFYEKNTNTGGVADKSIVFGNPGDIPLAGDWDGAGTSTIGVFRPSTFTFYFQHANGTTTSIAYGGTTSLPVVGDWDGNGTFTQGVVSS